MKKTFMLLALVVSGIAAWAQNADHSHVSGVVENSNGEKLVNAVVNFYSATDSLRHFPCVCDVEGYFNLEIPKGEYRYAISYMGQRFQNEDFRVNATAGSVRLRPIVVSVNETILDEVVVKANRPFVSYQGNNAVYNLAAHRGAAGGTVLDGLKFIPGMQVDGADGLSVFGFYKLTVAVNGRVLKLTDEEVKAYLATLGTADVEQIELIRNPGPEYGSLSGAVLNVVMKKKADEGINAFFSANLSYQRMLSEQANGRVNINEGKWRNFVAYNFTDRRRKEMLDTSIGCDTTVVNPQQSHLFQLGSELQIKLAAGGLLPTLIRVRWSRIPERRINIQKKRCRRTSPCATTTTRLTPMAVFRAIMTTGSTVNIPCPTTRQGVSGFGSRISASGTIGRKTIGFLPLFKPITNVRISGT